MIFVRLYENQGFTLIELVISIVVVSVALGGVLMAINYTVGHSADPMLQHQAVAIAESYMEEILLKPFADPDGVDAEIGRVQFDDIDDYNNLVDIGARDQADKLIGGLENYTVNVTVVGTPLNGIGAANSLQITVTVSHPVGFNMRLSGFRTNY
ncbi:MAG: pilus assembly protein MshD [Desulfuromonadales bacterium C00003094]|jgi:MSHA pilin protein MshD|nr:MAG: pilus assembly protein MshD [Desulfuromonadales bacterium C00003094]OEU72261.1 MAG: pilus assembly protein MshD [Desulfuromonadales bacterium C00003107]